MRLILIAFLFLFGTASAAENFSGPADCVARAEESRAFLARYWFGSELPTWNKPCPIQIRKAENLSGYTTFTIDGGHVFDWRMVVEGPTRSAAIDTVIPHEVNHTVFASRYRRRLPRWLDEGAATWVESRSEHHRGRAILQTVIDSGRFTPFRELLSESGRYPKDAGKLRNVYLQGFAIVDYLVTHHGGPKKFAAFVADVWTGDAGRSAFAALKKHYGYTPGELEKDWYSQWRAAKSPVCELRNCQAPHGARQETGRISVGLPECRLDVYSGALCGPCQNWKRDEYPKVKAAGVPVRFIMDNRAAMVAANVTSLPTFVVYHKHQETGRLVGYQTTAAILALWAKQPACGPVVQSPPIQQKPQVSLAEFQSLQARLSEMSAELVQLRGQLGELAALRQKASELEKLKTELVTTRGELYRLEQRINTLPRPAEPVDVNLVLQPLAERISLLEQARIPIRLETLDGVLVKEKEYQLELMRDKEGNRRLQFAPITLKFSERILSGG